MRRPPSPEQLDILRDTFRRQPPTSPNHFKAAGLLASVSEAVARRAYERGWPNVASIQAQLDDERARQQQSAELLKADRVVTTMKANAIVLQNEMRRLMPALKALTDNLLTREQAGDLARLPHETAVKTMQRLSKVHRDVAAISAKAVELDRLIAGEATSIVGHKQLDTEPPDLQKTKALTELATRALRRANAELPDDVAPKETPDVDTSVN